MASRADSEEQLGEEAPAGVPSIEVDRKGMPERYGEAGKQQEWEKETPPGSGVGGEPEVGGTVRATDTSEPSK